MYKYSYIKEVSAVFGRLKDGGRRPSDRYRNGSLAAKVGMFFQRLKNVLEN
jgi:hypothetical protein